MTEKINQFHLAIPVKDLESAKFFYRDILGAKEGRSTKNHIDFNFYGHHLVVHEPPVNDKSLFNAFDSDFYGEVVRVPHFGMNLGYSDWSMLAENIKKNEYVFFDPPHIRMKGMPGEHATLFVLDPSGNALEFKAFRNHNEVFSKVFDPNTKELFELDKLVVEAAEK